MTDEEPRGAEPAQRPPRRQEAERRVDADPLPTGPEVGRRPEGLGDDQRAGGGPLPTGRLAGVVPRPPGHVGADQRDLPPPPVGDDGPEAEPRPAQFVAEALDGDAEAVGRVAEGPRDVDRDAVALGQRGGVAPVAVEQEHDAGDLAQVGQPVVQAGGVDGVDEPDRVAVDEGVARALHRLRRVRQPRQAAVPLDEPGVLPASGRLQRHGSRSAPRAGKAVDVRRDRDPGYAYGARGRSGTMDWRSAEAAFEDHVMGRVTLPRMFADAADRSGSEVAQRYKGGIYDRTLAPDVVPAVPAGEWGAVSYDEMHDVVKRLATGFRELGVADGERVGIFAGTRMEWAQCDFAVLAAGGVVTTVYTSSSPRQVAYLLSDAGAGGVVVENGDLLDRVLEVEDEVDLEFVVVVDETDHEALSRDDVHTLAEVHALGEAGFDEATYTDWLDERDPDDLASLIYTSGTTGRPKGVELTHWNFKSNVDQVRRRYGPRSDKGDLPVVGPGSTAVSFLPLAHVFERLAGHFHPFSAGATVAYAESADTLREDFAAVGPTVGTSVPRVYEKIYAAIREQASASPVKQRIFEWAIEVGREHATTDEPGAWLSAKHAVADRLVFSTVREALGGNLELLLSGGGSLSADLIELYHGMGIPVLEGYGLTETSPVVTVNPFEAPKIGTIGPPVYDMETALDTGVVDEADFEDAPGVVGELLVRGPNVARGYWNKPEETAASFLDELPGDAVRVVEWEVDESADRGRWFRTGDIVAQDDEGYITFLERAKEVIVLSTGKNVAPTPLEDAFSKSDVVEQVMVVGDDEKFTGALVVPSYEALRSWAGREGVDLPDDPAAVCEDDRVRERIEREVEAVNRGFEAHETIKDFRLVPDEFTEENDLLTPSLKKKRRNILAYYDEQVRDLYAED